MAQQVVEVKDIWARETPREGEKVCVCTPKEKRECYRALLAKERRASEQEIESLVEKGVPYTEAYLAVMSAVREKARHRAAKVIETNEKGYCFLSFRLDLTEAQKTVSIFCQSVLDRVLESDPLTSSQHFGVELVRVPAEEFFRILDEKVVAVHGDSVRRFLMNSTASLIDPIAKHLR